MVKFSFLLIICWGSFFLVNSQNTVAWKKNYKLTWSDFKGIPDSSSPYAAISNIFIDYDPHFSSESWTFSAVCFFNRNYSWTKTHSQIVLRHEKGHFDLGEIYRRELLNKFRKYKYNPGTARDDVEKIHKKIMTQLEDATRHYDDETQHSTNVKMQNFWEKKIRENLQRVENFLL